MCSIGGSQLVFLTIPDGQSTNYAAPPADTRRVCACTFYLVFKEPEVAPLRRGPSLGEPYNHTKRPDPCQGARSSGAELPPCFASCGRAGGSSRRTLCKARQTVPDPLNIRSRRRTVNLWRFS